MDKQAQQTILVDLDGTLAEYKGWNGHTHIGDPVPIMARRIRRWLSDGKLVKIFTARFAEKDPKKRQEIVDAIQRWTQKHFGRKLKVTNEKDKSVTKIWDDRAMSVTRNKGRQTKLDYHEKHAALDPEQEESLRYGGGAALGGLAGGAVAGPGGAALGVLLGLAGLYGYRRTNPSEAAAGAAKVADPLMEKLRQRFQLLRLQQGYTPSLSETRAMLAPAGELGMTAATTALVAPLAVRQLRAADKVLLQGRAGGALAKAVGRGASAAPVAAAKPPPASFSSLSRLGKAAWLAKLPLKGLARVGNKLPFVALPMAAAGAAHGLVNPERFEGQLAGGQGAGWAGAGLSNAQDLLYRDLAGWYNVPGRMGAALRTAIPSYGRDIPAAVSGRSVAAPGAESYSKRLLRAAAAKNQGIATSLAPGVSPWFKAQVDPWREWWQQRELGQPEMQELQQPAVTELPPRE